MADNNNQEQKAKPSALSLHDPRIETLIEELMQAMEAGNVDGKRGMKEIIAQLKKETDDPDILKAIRYNDAIPERGNDPFDLRNDATLMFFTGISQNPARVIETLMAEGLSPLDEITYTIKDEYRPVENYNGMRPLHVLAGFSRLDVFHTMLEKYVKAKGNINHQDANGNTPLHLVMLAEHNSEEKLIRTRTLMRNGADLEIANKDGLRPLEMALGIRGFVEKQAYTIPDLELTRVLIDGIRDKGRRPITGTNIHAQNKYHLDALDLRLLSYGGQDIALQDIPETELSEAERKDKQLVQKKNPNRFLGESNELKAIRFLLNQGMNLNQFKTYPNPESRIFIGFVSSDNPDFQPISNTRFAQVALMGDRAVVQLMLSLKDEKGFPLVDINAKGRDGETALEQLLKVGLRMAEARETDQIRQKLLQLDFHGKQGPVPLPKETGERIAIHSVFRAIPNIEPNSIAWLLLEKGAYPWTKVKLQLIKKDEADKPLLDDKGNLLFEEKEISLLDIAYHHKNKELTKLLMNKGVALPQDRFLITPEGEVEFLAQPETKKDGNQQSSFPASLNIKKEEIERLGALLGSIATTETTPEALGQLAHQAVGADEVQSKNKPAIK